MRRLVLALVVFTFFTMFLGGWTRVANAGLACPDWPLCHGKLIPPLTYEIMLEYFHRLAVTLVSFTLVVVSVLVVRRADYRKTYGRVLSLALVLLVIQIVFGGLTVLKLLKGEIVATHLALGLSFFGTLVYFYLLLYRAEGGFTHLKGTGTTIAPVLVKACIAGVLAQVILGGMVSSHYAGLACPDFPTCQGLWFPALAGNVAYHFTHRIGAVVVTLLCAWLLVQLFRAGEGLFLSATVFLGLLLTQWALGIGLVILQLPQLLSVAHLATAIIIFGLLLVIHEQVKASRVH